MTTHLKINDDIQWRINLAAQFLDRPPKTTALGMFIKKYHFIKSPLENDSFGPLCSQFTPTAFVYDENYGQCVALCKSFSYKTSVYHQSLVSVKTSIIDISTLQIANDLTNRSKTRLSKCLAR